jgi:hypothetical protein
MSGITHTAESLQSSQLTASAEANTGRQLEESMVHLVIAI